MIINIHGFASNGLSRKAMILKERFKDEIISPSLSYVPKLAVDTLEQLIECMIKRGENVSLIGSSIGGYLSIYLSNKYQIKAVLINPAITPYKFSNFVGFANNLFDNSKFECTKEHLEELKRYELLHVKDEKNIMLLLQKGDELLDYNQAIKKFPNAKSIVEEGGSHGFDNFESKLPMIEKFLEI